ncbi:MAG TPA: 1,4-beta-xylanase [Dehalococcoidia bacterium]|nr:1,4-beta-xylanase [Dehalococcoidia bacterium]
MSARKQWAPEEAREWYDRQPWPIGCNYIPSNAVNQLEMWQTDTFDEAVNERELGWAAGLGFNTVRVYLHDLPWSQDAGGFLGRIDRFLAIAARHGIRPLFVLFDGVWDPYPKPGPQPAPVPHIHNSGWAQSPGAEILGDPARHDEMEPYVAGVIGHFRADPRVLGWDLFNEPDNPNTPYRDRELPDKAEKAFALLRKAYAWAREAGPEQPITSGVWRPEWVFTGALSEMDRFQLTESDVISFHAYVGRPTVEARLAELESYGRPVLLTEYLARPFGNTFKAILPLLRERKVAAYNWGLVSGKTQTVYPWDSWARRPDREPAVWFHDIMRADGTPYDPGEAEFLRTITRTP